MADRPADGRWRQRVPLAVAVVASVVVGAVGGFLLSGGDDAQPGPFAAKRDGLEKRLAEARLPLASDHIHPNLRVFVGTREIPVPDDIGMGDGDVSAPLHKHPGDPQLHAEGVKEGELTLGQVMKVWGVEFSPTQLGPYRAEGSRRVRLWVKPPGRTRFRQSREFERLRLAEGQEIHLSYGTPATAPRHP